MYNVMYVDDEPTLLEIGKLFLERNGEFVVDTLTSAKEALVQLETVHYDAIISDYQMPTMDGITFLKHLKASGNTIPFIIFTGRGREEVVIEALNSGADFYIQKGGEPKSQFAELAHKIKIAVESKRAGDALTQDECRLQALVTFYQMTSAPLKDLMTFAVEKAVEVTASTIGYLAFVSDDETVLTMYSWSVQAMKECNIDRKPVEYPLSTTGLWGEAVRQRRPVITNDYAAENPLKKGYPQGHVPVVRHMNIPVFDGPRIVMIAGVGNKPSGYDDRDVQELSLLMSGLWSVIKERRTEEELRNLNVYNRSLIEASLDPLVTIDHEGKIADVNQATELVTGYSRAELIGTDFSVYFTEPEKALEGYRKVFRDGNIHDYLLEIRNRDGHITPVLYNATVYRDETGAISGVFAAARDITGRRKAEEALRQVNEKLRANVGDLTRQKLALRESETRYRQFFKTTLDSVFITTPDGQWIDFNDALVEIFGYGSREEVFAVPVPSFYAHQEERDAFLERVVRDGYVKEHPLKFKKKDGTVFDTLITIVAQRNPDGSIKEFIGTVHDITRKKRVYAPSADRESFNQSRAEKLQDYIVVYGEDGKILYINPAAVRTMGYDAETLVGTPALSYVAEKFRDIVTSTIAARREKGDAPLYEIEIVARDGLHRSVIVKGTPILYHNTPATLLFLIDITRKKELEDQLTERAAELERISTAFQQSNKKLSLLSTITRHDINNQLTVVKGYLGILETEQHDPTLTAYCQKAITASERIESMIRFTKDYEEIGITLPAWQDCHRLVETAAGQIQLGEIRVKNDLPDGMEVFADPLIAKVFYNLMDNAVRYGGKITSIQFSAEESGNERRIVCEDDGNGVQAEDRERIFERGYGKNTGLGLALSREILDLTGITIHESGGPGRGARFVMTVPEDRVRFRHG
jgi:PAS domain S-box-containing protein